MESHNMSSRSCHSLSEIGVPLLRWEHRTDSGNGSQRILLFSSKRSGAIGKVIFSFSVGLDPPARVQALDVRPRDRGHGYGALLFRVAIHAINCQRKQLLLEQDCGHSGKRTKRQSHCYLDVEEDERRYGKLVMFYETLGCVRRKSERVQYLNNNDGETYRKVPMEINLDTTLLSHFDQPSRFSFLSIHTKGKPNGGSIAQFLLKEKGAAQIEILSPTDFSHVAIKDTNGDMKQTPHNHSLSIFAYSSSQLPENCLWLFRSEQHSYLGLDPERGEFLYSKTPVYWKTTIHDSRIVLEPANATPERLSHRYTSRERQSKSFVYSMHSEYLKFQRHRMTISQALSAAASLQHYESGKGGIDLRSYCFAAAESLRKDGHPDWLQVLGLIHGLPGIVDNSIADYDWRLLDQTWEVDGELHAGAKTTLMAWTPQEYLYWMLQFNNSNIPDEGLKILRFANFHSRKAWVRDPRNEEFDCALNVGRETGCTLNQLDCDEMWSSHYEDIVAKYALDGELSW